MTQYDDFDLNEFESYTDDESYLQTQTEELPYTESKSRDNVPVVTVFGAGVSGLTAAHELIQRGFHVQVVEKAEDKGREYTCQIGGLASSQDARLKRTRRLHWGLYGKQDRRSYIAASPILNEIQEERAYLHRMEIFEKMAEIYELDRELGRKGVKYFELSRRTLWSELREQVRTLLRLHPDLSRWSELNLTEEELNSIEEVSNLVAQMETSGNQEDIRSQLAELRETMEELHTKLREWGAFAVRAREDLDDVRALRERPMQQVQQRVALPQKITLPITPALTDYAGGISTFTRLEELYETELDELPSDDETQYICETTSPEEFYEYWENEKKEESLARLIQKIANIPDLHGEIQRQKGRFDPIYFNESKMVEVAKTVIGAIFQYSKDLDAELDLLRTSTGETVLLTDGLTRARELFLVEIRGHCNSFESVKTNQRAGVAWARLVRTWVECLIFEAFAWLSPQSEDDVRQTRHEVSADGQKVAKVLEEHLGDLWSVDQELTAARQAYDEARSARNRSRSQANQTNFEDAGERLTALQDRHDELRKKFDEAGEMFAHLANQLICVGMAGEKGDHNQIGQIRNNFVEFRVIEHVVLGEHGFRFFPGFYRHLFDTMKRTPMLNDQLKETGRSTYDQLIEPPPVRLGLLGMGEFVQVSRGNKRARAEQRANIEWSTKQLGFTPRDILRYQTQIVKFLTSSDKRRERYENFSWMEFVDGKSEYSKPNPEEFQWSDTGYTEEAATLLRQIPQLLMAMSADETDALTNGLISVQAMLDAGSSEVNDRMLNGPTTTSWLQHWKRFLKRQGVKFFVGELSHLEFRGKALVPNVRGKAAFGKPMPENPYDSYISAGQIEPSPDFYVLATPYEFATEQVWDVNGTQSNVEYFERLGAAIEKETDLTMLSDLPNHLLISKLLQKADRIIQTLEDYVDGKEVAGNFQLNLDASIVEDSSGKTLAARYEKILRGLRKDMGSELTAESLLKQYKQLKEVMRDLREHRHLHEAHMDLLPLIETVDLELANLVLQERGFIRIDIALHLLFENMDLEDGREPTDDQLEMLASLVSSYRKSLGAMRENLLRKYDGDLRTLLEFDIEAGRRDRNGDIAYERVGDAGLHYVPRSPRGMPQPQFKYPLRDLSGVQYYFKELVRVGHGHFNLPNSPWGITGVGQLYFWRRRPSQTHGFIGQLSVDIGDFYADYRTDGAFTGKTVFESSSQQIAQGVWEQIKDAASADYRGRVSPPRYYQIDNGLFPVTVDEDGERSSFFVNRNKLMINLPGQFDKRPGFRRIDGGEREIDYQVSNKRWVLSGNFMAAYTRLPSMENSNESGRLAVNAILNELTYTRNDELYNSAGAFLGDYCEIWDPADYEPLDFESFRELDQALFERGIPHMLDVLHVPQTIDKMSKRENPTDTPLYNLTTLIEEGFKQQLKNTELLRQFTNQTNLSSTDQVVANLKNVADFAEEALALVMKHMPSKGGGSEDNPG